uniref:NR LBD domain-containing protein n=1 Tax=Acrobeloides nanus TaxID=290746 RepID=A0A914EBG6_9BILA
MNPKAVISAYKNEVKEKTIKNKPLDNIEHNVILPSIRSVQDEINSYIENLLYIEVKSEILRRSDYRPFDENMVLWDLLNKPIVFNDASKYKIINKWPSYTIKETDIEPRELIQLGYKDWFFLDLLLGVDYLKTFSLLRELPEKDKYYLCRDVACTNAYLSSSYYAYNSGAKMIVYPDGTYPFITNSNLTETEQVLRDGKVKEFTHLKPDRIHYCLMKALISFNTYWKTRS